MTKIPDFAVYYPDVANTLEQARLPFYCCNCYRKRETTYLTPNFGPFCEECLAELRAIKLCRSMTSNHNDQERVYSCTLWSGHSKDHFDGTAEKGWTR